MGQMEDKELKPQNGMDFNWIESSCICQHDTRFS